MHPGHREPEQRTPERLHPSFSDRAVMSCVDQEDAAGAEQCGLGKSSTPSKTLRRRRWGVLPSTVPLSFVGIMVGVLIFTIGAQMCMSVLVWTTGADAVASSSYSTSPHNLPDTANPSEEGAGRSMDVLEGSISPQQGQKSWSRNLCGPVEDEWMSPLLLWRSNTCWWTTEYEPHSPLRPHAWWTEVPEAAVEPAAYPLVSVITPFTCSKAAVIGDTLESVWRQTLRDVEVLVIADGKDSADCLPDSVLQQAASKDATVRILKTGDSNVYLPAARNIAIREARADFIFTLDADDWLEPTVLEKLRGKLLYSPPSVGFAGGWAVNFYALRGGYIETDTFDRREDFYNRSMTTVAKMFKKSALVAAGGYDEELTEGCEDWDMYLRIASVGMWGLTVAEPMDWYRRKEVTDWKSLQNLVGSAEALRSRFPALADASNWPLITKELLLEWEVPDDKHLTSTVPHGAGRHRLMLIIPWMVLGGADMFNLNLVRLLSQRSWDITVVTTLPNPGGDVWELDFLRITEDVHVLPRLLPNYVSRAMYMVDLVKSRDPHVILVSNSDLGFAMQPWLRSIASPSTKIISYLHMEEDRPNDFTEQVIGNQQYTSHTIVASKHLLDYMSDRGHDPDRMSVCHVNVDAAGLRQDPERRQAMRNAMEVYDDSIPVILYSARLVDQKNPLLMARTIIWMVEQDKEAEFILAIAGEGYMQEEVERLLRRHRSVFLSSKAKIRMMDRLEPEEMPDMVSASDIFFLPSKYEGISISMYEAMAAGLAVVGSDVGGQTELITPDCGCGILLKSENEDLPVEVQEDTLVQRYGQHLLTLIRRPEVRKRMAAMAQARVLQHFSLEDMADCMESQFLASSRFPQAQGQTEGADRDNWLENIRDLQARFMHMEVSGNVERILPDSEYDDN